MVLNQREEMEENNNVIPFSVVPGGKGPKNKNWLQELNKGCVFLCKPVKTDTKEPNFILYEYIKFSQLDLAVQLVSTNNQHSPTFMWVDSEEFCSRFEFQGIIGYQQIEE